MKKAPAILIILSALIMGLSGCAATQDTRFYLLSSLPQTVAGSQVKKAELTLGIGPVNIPEYLDRPQIVTRSSRNALRLAEFHNWAEQLKINIAQVVAENLSILLSTDQVKLYPWPQSDSPIDYQVLINVIQFERNPAGDAVLLARWSINSRGKTVLTGRTAHITVRPKGHDYKSLAGALSETLADLSREIAGVIKPLRKKRGGKKTL